MAALGKKTVVLVTHQVEFLSKVDRILVKSKLKSFYVFLFSPSILYILWE